jgi:hypothetical protein
VPGEGDEVGDVEGAVESYAGGDSVGQVVEFAGVREQVLGLELLDRLLDEELLALDATEVVGAVADPVAVGVLVFEVTGPGQGQGGGPVELDAAGVLDVDAAVEVTHGNIEVGGDPTDGIDEVLEPGEVDLDVVIDGDTEVGLDGVHQRLRAE